jgi:BirA family transcriptional regulator, biotin operon repressor / biotin---[acetyl-CoA-carboxylase] ligase
VPSISPNAAIESFQYEHVAEIDSTNAELLRRAQHRNIHGLALSADFQTAGRGQRGRAWVANAGDALLLSVGWRFAKAHRLDGLSLAVGVSVAEALQQFAREQITLKWPNDVMLSVAGKRAPGKLGGILIETIAAESATHGQSRIAVIGIGINLATPLINAASANISRSNPPTIEPAALTGRDRAVSIRSFVMTALLSNLADSLTTFANKGFAPFKSKWWEMHAYQKSAVEVLAPSGEVIVGHIVEVSDTGALIVESKSGRHTLVSGEVSLRPR